MKNFKLNLKGLYGYRQSLLSRSPQPRDNREMSERRPSEERTLLATVPQRFARYAAMLIMLLTLGIGQMWGGTVSGGEIYFDATQSGWGNSLSSVEYIISHDGYSCWYAMTKIPNTNLYYISSGSWGDSKYFAFTANYGWASSGDNCESNSYDSRKSYGPTGKKYTSKSTYGVNSGSTYLFYASSSNDDAAITTSSPAGFLGSGKTYTALNYTQTLNQTLSTDGGSTFSASTASIATVKVSSYKLNGASSSTSTSGTIAAASSSTSCSAARTATVTYTVSSIATGYEFVGWYEGSTQKSTSTTYTYNATGAKTITARFKETQYSLTFSHNGHGSISVGGEAVSSGSTAKVNHFTTKTLVATANTGYHFAGWTKSGSNTSAVTIGDESADGTSTTIKATNTGATVTAGFTAKTYSITLDDDGEYQGNGSATAMYNSNSLSIASHASRTDYRIEGYFAPGTGDQVTDASGNLLPNKTGNTGSGVFNITDASCNWVYDGDLTLYAHWIYDVTEYAVTFAVGTSYTSLGSLTAYNNTTSSAISSGANVRSGQSLTFTAAPNTGYAVEGWYTNAACTEGKHSAGSTTYTTSIGAATNVYVKFVEKTWTVSFANDGHGTTTPSSDQTVGQLAGISISATPNTGYTFNTWTITSGSGSFTSAVTTNSNTFKPTAASTITASFNETMRTITISGGHVYGGVATSTTAGVATSAKITANAPAAGKKFTGWSLGAGVSLKAGSALTDQTIEIYSTANATVTATYADRAQVKMYFAKPSSWSTVYAHAWGGSDPSTEWPGIEITETTETINHVVYNVFSYYTEADGIGGAATGSAGWTSVVFSDNGAEGKKTADLTISNGHYYFKSSAETGKAAALTSAWCIMGSFNSWSEDADQITHSSATAGSKSITLTTGDKTFKIYNIVNETWWRFSGNVTASKAATAMNNADGNMTLAPTIAGSYTFALGSLDGTPTLAITYPTSYRLTYAIGTVKGNEDETSIISSPSTASGSYVPGGNTVTLTAPDEKEGKYEWRGWYIDAAGTGAQQCATKEYEVTMDGTKTLYACYTEIKHDVTVEAGENGSVSTTSVNAGVATKSATITATPDPGYYFSGWTIPDGVTIATGSGTNVITINATADEKTITANFTELDKIYFRNLSTMEGGAWANVYVYFGVTWSGEKGVQTLSTYANMTQIGTSDIYWAYVPRSFTTSAGTAVAFSNTDMHTWNDFYGNKGAYRTDYNKALNMFVPYHKSSGTTNTTVYYSDGYWKNYPVKAATGAGYYLQTTRGTDLAEFTGQADNLDIIECTVRVDQHDQDKTFHIVSAGGKYFEPYNYSTSKYPKITSTASTMTMKGDDSDGLTVTLTSEGNYRFIIDQSSDVMELTVVYPVGVGDYRIKHSYSDSGTKYAYSDIIKSSDSHPTVSMFYNPSSATMVLQKCTLVNASGPEWNEGTAIDRDKLNKGAGVYQFDLTISGEAGTIDDGAGLYDGPFYIKTDCASGGWANFTANIMDKNTANPTAFDYYFMKWIDLDTENSETKNIKCVIANQYNNAISDTLKSDGIATMVYGEPVLDNDGSVRFSYNSKTNTLKRAYLTGASSLTLETYASGFIYNEGGETDQYGRHPGFVDDVVWTYELTVDAKLGAKAGLRAVWVNKAGTSKEQTLIENDNPIISGTGSGKYKMRLVFDFKTNALISSWTPSGEITDKLKDVDVMLVREGQAASDVITFGDGGSLEPRKLVGSLKFKKTTYFGNVASWNSTTRPLLTFFVSFPFDVKVSDVFGLNSAYGDAYVIRKYDGAERASKGFFRGDGTTSFWKDLTTKDTMNAYEGYIVVLDNDYFNSDAYSLWGGKSELYLYFPSSKGGIISEGSKTIPVPEHECRIDRTFDNGSKILNHMNTDSHWNLIGVPVFTTYDDDNSPAEGTPGAIFADIEGEADAFNYFYEWNSTGNDFAISSAKDYEFKAMHGYMVQYHGDVTFIGSVFTPASVAARRTVEKKNYDIELQVLNNEAEMLNRTYVALRDGASSEFVLNEDVYLSPNNRDAEIYTFAGEYDVAANRLPVENQLVQMGLNVHKAGNYTISMPSTFSGTATLVDTYTNTRTNLAIDEYEVNLPQGTCEDRFLLELNIHKVPTAIDGVDGGSLKDGNAHKFIMNDRMYILKNGVIYDACGNRVQ